MKVFIFLLTLTLCFIIAGSTAYGQNRRLSGGLGLSDAEWKELFGSPTPFARDAWSYRGGRYYTRSWYRRGAPAGRDYPGYIADNYYVKRIEIVWGRNNPVSSAQARTETKARLPIDTMVIAKYRKRGSRATEYYSSEYLATRLFPGMAGDNYCVTPWGSGVGKFKVEYYFVKGRVWRAVIDIGEPHEAPLEVCRGNLSSVGAPNSGMHPARISVDVIRQIECLRSCLRAGDAGRYAASLSCAVVGLWRGDNDDFHS